MIYEILMVELCSIRVNLNDIFVCYGNLCYLLYSPLRGLIKIWRKFRVLIVNNLGEFYFGRLIFGPVGKHMC
jgi:hypothetical protein